MKYLAEFSLIAGIVAAVGVVFIYSRTTFRPARTEAMPNVALTSPTASVTREAQPVVTTWGSPEGKKFLRMKALTVANGETSYDFSVSDTATQSGQVVFSKIASAGASFNIPYNTWEPGNKHFFVQETNLLATHSYVVKADGAAFADGQNFIDVNTVFADKQTGMVLKEVTGWAAPGLLIINTQTANSEQGPSYWFDIHRQSLIRLSTKF